jgi:N6-adenosine-specific RNA methylase IME4
VSSGKVELVRYDAACRALAEAHRVDEVKTIRDKAVAMQAYARQAKDTTLITQATEIRMRAERRAGELLREMEKYKGAVPGKTGRKGKPLLDTTPKLSDLGVTKTQSSRWQKLAALDADKFEAEIEHAGTRAYDMMTSRFLKEAEIERTKQRHSKLIEHGCTVNDLVALAESGKRFPVIYADAPWPWITWGERGSIRSSPGNHYGTSTIEEIAALPVAPLAADNCALFLWGTWPWLPQCVEVLEAWGFAYKTAAFVWVKQNEGGNGLHTGMGYFTRSNTEYVLLATKGAPKRIAEDVHQVIMAPVGEHSAKPEEVRRRIERLFPGPYLELYGRKPVDGWTVWGNEIKRATFARAATERADARTPARKEKSSDAHTQ